MIRLLVALGLVLSLWASYASANNKPPVDPPEEPPTECRDCNPPPPVEPPNPPKPPVTPPRDTPADDRDPQSYVPQPAYGFCCKVDGQLTTHADALSRLFMGKDKAIARAKKACLRRVNPPKCPNQLAKLIRSTS